MEKINKLFSFIKRIKIPSYHLTSIYDSILVVVFTTLPTILAIFNSYRKTLTINLTHTYIVGDFFLYCIALLSSSYLVFNQLKISESNWKSGINKLILVALVLISSIYAIITIDEDSNQVFMKWSSIFALLVGVGVFYSSQLTFNKQYLDVPQERRDEQQTIQDSLS